MTFHGPHTKALYQASSCVHPDDIWTNNFCHLEMILLGDSIVKYVDGISNLLVIAFKGIKLEELGARINNNQIPELCGKYVVFTHVGTNNV